MTIRVSTGQVEYIYSGKYNQKTAEKGDCVDSVGGIKSLKKNERGTQRSGSEGNVVERIDS